MLTNLIQKENHLIGTDQAIENLAHKAHARILVISDSHGHPELLIKIIRRYGKDCDALAFCGDGAGDLVTFLSALNSDEELKNCTPSVIAFVRGNGDPSSYPLNNQNSIIFPDSQILTVNNNKIMIVHGHKEGIDFGLENLGFAMQLNNCKTAFYGHTHIAREDNISGFKFVNPGSIARPRGGQPSCFAIATAEKDFIDIAFIKMEMDNSGKTGFKIWKPIY